MQYLSIMLNTCITLHLHVHIDGMFILIFLRMGIWLVIALFSIQRPVDFRHSIIDLNFGVSIQCPLPI